jgi:ATP synthase protein I
VNVVAYHLARQGRHLATVATSVQSIFAALLVLICWIFFQRIWVEVALGCLAAILPNAVFAVFAFKFSGATKSDLVVRSFSQGAKTKLVLTAVIFAYAFSSTHAQPVPLMAAYISAMLCYFVVLYRKHSQ